MSKRMKNQELHQIHFQGRRFLMGNVRTTMHAQITVGCGKQGVYTGGCQLIKEKESYRL